MAKPRRVVRPRRAASPPEPPVRRRGGRPPPAVVPGSLPRDPTRLTVLAEPPHGHIVCRVCGRIAEVLLDTEAQLRLEHLAERRPDGWSVELVSFSLTGACARCREGPAAPG